MSGGEGDFTRLATIAAHDYRRGVVASIQKRIQQLPDGSGFVPREVMEYLACVARTPYHLAVAVERLEAQSLVLEFLEFLHRAEME